VAGRRTPRIDQGQDSLPTAINDAQPKRNLGHLPPQQILRVPNEGVQRTNIERDQLLQSAFQTRVEVLSQACLDLQKQRHGRICAQKASLQTKMVDAEKASLVEARDQHLDDASGAGLCDQHPWLCPP
jgi:hypothetical protein